MIKKLSLETFKSIYSQVPRLCVDVVIKTSEGVLLTLRNNKPKGFWHIPGGTVLLDESVEQAVVRVAKEELGVKVKVVKFLGIIDFYKNKSIAGHPISVAYQVNVIGGKISLDNQSSEAKYFRISPKNMLKEQKIFINALTKNV